MATTLQDRGDLRAAFYTLMNSDPDDDSLGEHYTDPDEAANRYLQQGLESAQMYVIEYAADGAMRWLKRLDVTWTDDPDVGEFVDLPDDFLRLSGDETHSPLLDGTGRPWGALVRGRERNRMRFGRGMYLRNNRLYLVRQATRPDPAVLEYHYRLPVLADDADTIEFPVADRWLIVAYAGQHAIMDAWPAGGQETELKVDRNLRYWKSELARRWRRSRQPQKIRTPQHVGPGLILGRRFG